LWGTTVSVIYGFAIIQSTTIYIYFVHTKCLESHQSEQNAPTSALLFGM
jgi:heme/copper-type cytochrome/quinol oxidase subunit 4